VVDVHRHQLKVMIVWASASVKLPYALSSCFLGMRWDLYSFSDSWCSTIIFHTPYFTHAMTSQWGPPSQSPPEQTPQPPGPLVTTQTEVAGARSDGRDVLSF
jgi:hypothetical protein